MTSLEEDALKAYDAIFRGAKSVDIRGEKRRVSKTSRQGLRLVESDDYVFLEQNPEKNSAWGQMARGGHRILWVIEDGDYVGQVRDGVFHDFRKPPHP